MKKMFKELLEDVLIVTMILFVYSPVVFAQQDISDSTGIVGNGRYLGAKSVDGQLIVPVLGVDANNDTVVNANSGDDVVLSVAKTPAAKINSTGGIYSTIVNSPILVSTPVAGTNFFPPGLSVVPPTVTANTAAFVGAATPIAGTKFSIYNSSASSVYVKAAGGATINGTLAAGRFILATRCGVDCVYTSATNLYCMPPVCATPLAP